MERLTDESRLQYLIRMLLDEEIDDVELQELADLIRDDPAAMDDYLSCLTLDAELAWEYGCGSLSISEQPAKCETSASKIEALPKREKRVAPMLRGAVLLAILFILVVLAVRSVEEVGSVVATKLKLDFIEGEWEFVSEGQVLEPKVGMHLLRKIDITTHGPTSLARFVYDDGSRVLIAGETLIGFSGDEQKKLQVHRGTISASIVSHPGDAPMVVATPQARLEGRDAEFSLDASREKTDLQVTQGSVTLTRIADGQKVVVPQGSRIETTGLPSRLTIRDIVTVPSTWYEDFEDGRPASWRSGTFIDSDLPTGSRGAVQAVLDNTTQIYVVTSPHPWVNGLFVVQPDTHLHITYKMSHPDWINVFFITRTHDPGDPTTFLYKFNQLPSSPSDSGRWRTATIPLRNFDRKTASGFEPGAPTSDEVVFGISCSAPAPDRGLVIDRLWVTEDGLGKFEIHDAH